MPECNPERPILLVDNGDLLLAVSVALDPAEVL